jgi:hypothetical protein
MVRSMRGQPHILFLAFSSIADPMLESWSRFRNLVDRETQHSVRPDAHQERLDSDLGKVQTAVRFSGIWRLLASNNREVGRSAFLYGSFASAQSHVRELQARTDELAVTTYKGPNAGTHGWFASINDVPMITCGRWYETDTTSTEAGIGSILALRSALIAERPRQIVHRSRPDFRSGR